MTNNVANRTILVATGKDINRDLGSSGERNRASQITLKANLVFGKRIMLNTSEGNSPVAVTCDLRLWIYLEDM